MSVEDQQALAIMDGSAHQESDGHWCLRLPWRKDPPDLTNNRSMAESRLYSIKRRLNSDSKLKKEYTAKVESYIQKGHAVKLPPQDKEEEKKEHSIPKWYLPHHAVVHPQKHKVRVVFDCSSRFNGVSLNDQLMQGPDLLNSLVGVLLRFRQEPVAIAADIEEMFHQVRVQECDRNALRFLWFEGGNMEGPPTEYQMTVHLFGATSSPSVCCRALQLTAENNKVSYNDATCDTILRNFYMDDLLKSVATSEEASSLVKELVAVLREGGFRLNKWISNHPDVLESIPVSERAESVKEVGQSELPTERALGVIWDVEKDNFKFRVAAKDKPSTRRGILSEASSLYDPCGFAAPVVLLAKHLLQDLSIRKCDWDEEVPDDIGEKWKAWKEALPSIQNVTVDRCYRPANFGAVESRQLHLFCDASEVGYGVAVYLRLQDTDGKVHISFVYGKSRLSPAKTVSIPRLELAAATLAAQVSLFIQEEIQQEIHSVVFWSDSTTVLRYIRNTKKRFKVFVSNRLTTIRSISSADQWRYVPGNLNPADAASRGIMPDDQNGLSAWLRGPAFLNKDDSAWPLLPSIEDVPSDDKELKAETAQCSLTVAGEENLLDELIARHSSWSRLRRTMAWILRFIGHCRGKSKEQGNLTVEEIQQAETALVVHVQKGAFQEEHKRLSQGKGPKKGSQLQQLCPVLVDGVLRVGGRLSKASIEDTAKHPAILPSMHHLTTLLVRHTHEHSGHTGIDHVLSTLRSKYWIVKGRATVKRVLRSPSGGCVLCKRYTAARQNQLMADLPSARVKPVSRPFTEIGIDYFGPLHVKFKRGTAKRWGCLFTCLSSRAVHIEIAHSLDTASFLAAFQRFIARRGKPTRVYSDNGTNFVAGNKELQDQLGLWNESMIEDSLSQQGIQWSFNPPTASHMGGIWERMIRSVRCILQKLLHEQLVHDESLLTLMAEVEKVLNDRPLWPPSSDAMDQPPLTPNHLLLLQQNQSMPLGIFSEDDNYSRKWWKQCNYLANIFWARWLKEYLPTLQARRKWTQLQHNLKVGDIVLVVEENSPRGQWPLGRIMAVYPDKKGAVRTVDVLMRKAIRRRPIHKLCLLEQA